jgi:hypothetical protein
MKGGYEQHYLKLMNGKELEGLLFVNIDQNVQTEFRAYIRHMSVMDKSKFSEALKAVTEYIWQNLYADTIRVDLYHFRPEGDTTSNPSADNDIKTALGMEKKGFKWKTLINDPSGKRYQIMQMNKPKDLIVSQVVR